MKITCDRGILASALAAVAPAIPGRTTRPVLNCVKLLADGDSVTLTAYDTEVGIRRTFTAEVQRGGTCLIPHKQLADIVKESSEQMVSIEANNGTVVRFGKSKFNLPEFPVEEFPDLPNAITDAPTHEIAAGVVRRMIRRSAFAADKKDSTRFALSGVLWEVQDGSANLVGTDSKRLAIASGQATTPAEAVGKTALIPARSLNLLERNLGDEGELVSVQLSPSQAVFRTGQSAIYTRLVEGRYPPFRDIVSQSRKKMDTTFTMPVGEFLSRVRQAAIMADGEGKRVDMTFGQGLVTMQARGADVGSSQVEMGIDYMGADIAIAFDPSYLSEFLRVIEDAGKIDLHLADGSKPALFTVGEDYQYLVMPLAQ